MSRVSTSDVELHRQACCTCDAVATQRHAPWPPISRKNPRETPSACTRDVTNASCRLLLRLHGRSPSSSAAAEHSCLPQPLTCGDGSRGTFHQRRSACRLSVLGLEHAAMSPMHTVVFGAHGDKACGDGGMRTQRRAMSRWARHASRRARGTHEIENDACGVVPEVHE